VKRVLWVVLLIIVIAITPLISMTKKRGAELLVYLPAAGRKVWDEVIPVFEERYGVKVSVVYGSSGALLEQAYVTQRGDLLGAATPPYMERAKELGMVYEDSVRIIACMKPAILYVKDINVTTLDDLLKGEFRIAICDPQTCAAGQYFKYILEKRGMWNELRNKIVVYTPNFSKLVGVLLLGDVDVALGWSVAASWYPRIRASIVDEEGPYKPCITVGILRTSSNTTLAKIFEEFLHSNFTLSVFEKYGYDVEVVR